jgi:hypothetical protein
VRPSRERAGLSAIGPDQKLRCVVGYDKALSQPHCNTAHRIAKFTNTIARDRDQVANFARPPETFRNHRVMCRGRENPPMRRLALWLKHFFGKPPRHSRENGLPFSTEEFGRLISSGKSEDMKTLAEGLSCAAISESLKAFAASDPASQQQFLKSVSGRKPKLRPPTSSAS